MKTFETINSATFVSVLGQCSGRRLAFVATHSWSGYLSAGTLMSCTAWGALAPTPSLDQHCQVEQGLMPGSALTLSRLQPWGKVPSSSNASGCKAPPGTVTTSSCQCRAEAAPTGPAPSRSDPAPQRALAECPMLFAGIPHSPITKGHLSLPPPFYQPSVASPFHGSFTDVTADLLYKIFPPASLCLCFVVWFFLI